MIQVSEEIGVFDANVLQILLLAVLSVLIDHVACESIQMLKTEKRWKKQGSCTRTGLSKQILWYLAHPGYYLCFVAGT